MNDVVCYDLDGVILPDMIWDINLTDAARRLCKPLFIPPAPYAILSSRDSKNYWPTKEYISVHLKDPPPEEVILRQDKEPWTLEVASRFKAQALIKHEFLAFVESDRGQAAKIRKLLNDVRCPTKVFVFQDLVTSTVKSHVEAFMRMMGPYPSAARLARSNRG